MVYGVCSTDLAQDPGGHGGFSTLSWPHLVALESFL